METNPRTKPAPMSREDIALLWFITPLYVMQWDRLILVLYIFKIKLKSVVRSL